MEIKRKKEKKRNKIIEGKTIERKVEKRRALRCDPKMEKSRRMQLMRSFGRVPSAAPRKRERYGIGPLWTRMTRAGARTKEGQGVKTEAVGRSNKLQLHYWN